MKNALVIKLKYISHIKPNFLGKKHAIFSAISCKQLLYFFFFISFFFNLPSNPSLKYSHMTIFSYKKKKKLPSFLRAPYRHKKAQINLKTSFFFINVSYNFFCGQYISYSSLIHVYSYLLSSFNFFDSPLLSLHKQQFTLLFSLA